MRLLIITQTVDENNPILGFFCQWISEFAKRCEKITVICLWKGEYSLQKNVKVFSLGKEKGRSRLKYLFNFYKYIWRERKNYDSVFVHMNQIYVILGGFFWRLWRKKIGLWYAHGSVSFSLKVAANISDVIFTSTKSGFRLKNSKIQIVGQGIDVSKFKPNNELQPNNLPFKIITIGRISPSKNYETLIKAAKILRDKKIDFTINIIGGTGLKSDERYLANLQNLSKENNLEKSIKFLGPVSNKDIAGYLREADLFVNMSFTGSLDKAILEAMACGLPILTCNESVLDILGDLKDKLMYPKGDFEELAKKIKYVFELEKEKKGLLSEYLRNIVVKYHNIGGLIEKILEKYK